MAAKMIGGIARLLLPLLVEQLGGLIPERRTRSLMVAGPPPQPALSPPVEDRVAEFAALEEAQLRHSEEVRQLTARIEELSAGLAEARSERAVLLQRVEAGAEKAEKEAVALRGRISRLQTIVWAVCAWSLLLTAGVLFLLLANPVRTLLTSR